MHVKHFLQIAMLLLGTTVIANPLTVYILTSSSTSSSTFSTQQSCLCMTEQRGVFCGSRSLEGLFDPEHPIFTGDCNANTIYTCVSRGKYPFEPREAVDCGFAGCYMNGSPDSAGGFDDCVR